MKTNLTIGIIGGGPGGLTLARILAVRGISAQLFELDEHPLARPQGGTLDLHQESGLMALRLAGLQDAFDAVARYEDQEMRLYDGRGVLRMEHSGSVDRGRPEIDRTQLRALLLDSLPAASIRWGCKVRSVAEQPNGRFRIEDAQGPLGEFDWVVGADGTWSVVRPLLSPAQPVYSGVTFIELAIDDVDRRHPAIARMVGHGKASILVRDGLGLIAQRNSHAHIRVYLSLRVPEGWIEQGHIDLSSGTKAKADLKQLLAGCHESVLALVDHANDHIVARPLVALPVGHRYPHRRGLTLLGDAAHVMSPFGGEGVNLAMQDAAELACALADSEDWDSSVARYEQAMFTRAAPAAAGAAQGLQLFSGEGAMDRVTAFFAAHLAPSQG